MSLVNIRPTITLDIYDHNLTPSTIKAIALDSGTRFVTAMIRDRGEIYDIGQDAAVVLTVVRPDKTKVQITGQTYSLTETTRDDETITYYGASAELTQLALAIKGNLRAQFKITSGTQELRTEIFAINCGEALDASTDTWAGEYQGYNLDELVQNVNSAVATVTDMETDVSELKSGISELQDGGYVADAQKIQEKIDKYLDEHPEATTTVQDGSLTKEKLTEEFQKDINKLVCFADSNTHIYAKPLSKGHISIPDGYSCGSCCLDTEKEYLYVGVYEVGTDSNSYILKLDYSEILLSNIGDDISPIETISLESVKSHMNSMCYYNDKIYIGAYRNDIGGSYNNINIIDLSNNSVHTVALPTPLSIAGVGIVEIDDVINVIAYYSDYSVYQVWHIINDTLMPVYSIEPYVNGSYIAQDFHLSSDTIYQLESENNRGTVKVASSQIQVISQTGRLSYFIHLDAEMGELEGIIKESGLDKFLLVNASGNFYLVETTIPDRSRDVLDLYSYKQVLNNRHQLFPSLSDTIENVCEFGTNTKGYKYLRTLIVPARTFLTDGFPINFFLGGYMAGASVLGNNMIVDLTMLSGHVRYELQMAYQRTNNNIGNHSGYTRYYIWEDGCRLKTKAIDGTEAWYTGINAINNIPTNMSIGADTTRGYPANIGYLPASDILI